MGIAMERRGDWNIYAHRVKPRSEKFIQVLWTLLIDDAGIQQRMIDITLAFYNYNFDAQMSDKMHRDERSRQQSISFVDGQARI